MPRARGPPPPPPRALLRPSASSSSPPSSSLHPPADAPPPAAADRYKRYYCPPTKNCNIIIISAHAPPPRSAAAAHQQPTNHRPTHVRVVPAAAGRGRRDACAVGRAVVSSRAPSSVNVSGPCPATNEAGSRCAVHMRNATPGPISCSAGQGRAGFRFF